MVLVTMASCTMRCKILQVTGCMAAQPPIRIRLGCTVGVHGKSTDELYSVLWFDTALMELGLFKKQSENKSKIGQR